MVDARQVKEGEPLLNVSAMKMDVKVRGRLSSNMCRPPGCQS
jgi:hypothetical protein